MYRLVLRSTLVATVINTGLICALTLNPLAPIIATLPFVPVLLHFSRNTTLLVAVLCNVLTLNYLFMHSTSPQHISLSVGCTLLSIIGTIIYFENDNPPLDAVPRGHDPEARVPLQTRHS